MLIRYVSAQRCPEALEILHSVACIQLAHGQVICAAELASLFVETLVKGKIPYDGQTLWWSYEFGANSNGSLELHIMLAEYIYSESPEVDMGRVTYLYVRGNDPKKFASTLVNFLGKILVAKNLGVPVEIQRYWLWRRDEKNACRPRRTLTPVEEEGNVDQLRTDTEKFNHVALNLFLEKGLEHGMALPQYTKEDLLLFFKSYDPVEEKLCYIGRLFVKSSDKPSDITMELKEMAGYDLDEQIDLYQEITFEPNVMCELIKTSLTFQAQELETGSIICIQKALAKDGEEHVRHRDVPSYLKYVFNRQIVQFRKLHEPELDDLCLEMTRLSTYDDVVNRLALKLNLDDPSKIRLTPHNQYSDLPRTPHPIKYRGVEHLLDMLLHDGKASYKLYYEVLHIPLQIFEDLITLNVAFHSATQDENFIHSITLSKQSTLGDFFNDLKTKVDMSHPEAELRLLQVLHYKIHNVFLSYANENEKIENINPEYFTYRVEEIPIEEKNLGPSARVIQVYHFAEDTPDSQILFGDPFFFVIHKGETLDKIKGRIQKKLKVVDDYFAKWRFAFVKLGRPPRYLSDSVDLFRLFQGTGVYSGRDKYGIWLQSLGIEHINNATTK